MRQTTVTCHECEAVSSFYVQEWPPKIFVCMDCGSIFRFVELSKTDEPIFHLVGYCRYDND